MPIAGLGPLTPSLGVSGPGDLLGPGEHAMRRSRKPLSVVRRIEGSNPSPSAFRTSDAGLRHASGVRFSPLASGEVHCFRCAVANHWRTGRKPRRRVRTPGAARGALAVERRKAPEGVRPLEIGVEKRSRLFLVARHQVAVAVVRDRDRRMAHVRGQRACVYARGDH